MSLVSGEPGESRCPRLVWYLWPARRFWHVNKVVHSFILESRVLRVTCIRCNGWNPFSMPDALAPVRRQVEAVGMRRCKYWWPQLLSEYCWVLLSQSLDRLMAKVLIHFACLKEHLIDLFNSYYELHCEHLMKVINGAVSEWNIFI